MASESITERQRKAARNQSAFRAVNERLNKLALDVEILHEFVCECADTNCDERLSLTVDEYEAARQIPTHFVITLGHEVPEVERVVVQAGDRYAIVEKYGAAGTLAVLFDPRRHNEP